MSLIERLRAKRIQGDLDQETGFGRVMVADPDCSEAATKLEAMQAEIDRLRAWRDEASLSLSGLREDAERSRKALKLARGWLNMVASERPETSDIHAVLAEVDASLETRSEK